MTTDTVEEVDRTTEGGDIRPRERRGGQYAEAVVAAMYEDAERSKRREVEEALGKLDAQGELGSVRREAVEEMAEAIVERILAAPARSVGEADDEATLDAAVRLFDLDVDVDDHKPQADGLDRSEVPSDDD